MDQKTEIVDRKKYLVVTAGGSGVRMGADRPKQFLTVGGKAILQMTVERFLEACPGIRVVTVLPKEHFSTWKEYCIAHNFHVPQTLVAGGITRFHSVRNALAKIPDGALVAVHDGVRPFVSKELIERMFDRMTVCRALIPVMPATDTLKLLDRDRETGLLRASGERLDRSRVFGAQTPQIFRSEDLKAAYAEAYDPLFTDDASVAESMKIPLSFIEGERFNIKITTPEDLVLADAILRFSSRSCNP